MVYEHKTKEQLTGELVVLRREVEELRKLVLGRKAIEDALQESEKFTSSLLETSPIAILVTNPDTSIRYVNSALEKLTQFSTEELIGRKAPYPWCPTEEPDETVGGLDEARRSRARRRQRLFRKKNGTQFWVEVTLAPVRRNGKLKYYLENWIDITERKQAEHFLNRRIKELVCHYGIAKVATRADITFDEVFQKVADLLPMACQFPEITCARIVIHGREFKTANYRKSPWQQSSSIRWHGVRIGVIEVNYLEERAGIDQGLFLREERLSLEVVAATVGEIAERMHAGELFAILSNSSPVGVYIVRDGKFEYVNPEFQESTGYTESELLGTNSLGLVHPEDRSQVRRNSTKMLKGQLSSPYEYRCLRKDGQVRWIMETVTSITYEGRRAALGYYMDITERKELEWDLIKYKELDELKRNLLSTVSHELRTPLGNIKGYANMLIDYQHKLSDAQKREFILGIEKDADRLTGFVSDLLNLSRLEAGLLKVEKKPRSSARLLREVVAEARIRSPRHQIVLRVAERLPRVSIDVGRIKQVLDNLIDNAGKYSAEGTEIAVSARQADGGILVGVSDRGMGIPARDLEKVFSPMYRIEHKQAEKVSGLGLGLSVCKGLVEAHGGRIWIESEVGAGSTCWFTLPKRARSKSVRDAR